MTKKSFRKSLTLLYLGQLVPLSSKDNRLDFIHFLAFMYIEQGVTPDEAVSKADNLYSKICIAAKKTPIVSYISLTIAEGMVMFVSVVGNPTIAALVDNAGVVVYVENITVPEFSEFGYAGFEKRRDGAIYRIW